MKAKKIRVLPIFGAHQIYQEIVNYPPKNVEYIGTSEETKKGNYYESKKLKEFLGRILQKIRIPRMKFLWPGDYDFVHSSRGIIPITNKPWAIDMEHVHSFFGLNPQLTRSKFWKRYLERKIASKNCKAILCHCEATRQSFFHYLDCSKFKEKIQVLYPSSHIPVLKKSKNNKIRILAVLSLFKQKGGEQILEAFSRLEKKYPNIELVMRADVPASLKKKYDSENIIYEDYFGDIISREDLLQKTYANADIFVYTTFCDSFGYSLIDALVAGLPIVGTNLFAVPEVVNHNENGLIVKIPGYNLKEKYLQLYEIENLGKNEGIFVKDLEIALERLIKDKKLREDMGRKSLEMIKTGKFSLEERNKKLGRIYENS